MGRLDLDKIGAKLVYRLFVFAFIGILFCLNACKSRDANVAADLKYSEEDQERDFEELRSALSEYADKFRRNAPPEVLQKLKRGVLNLLIRLNYSEDPDVSKLYFVIKKLLDYSQTLDHAPEQLKLMKEKDKRALALKISDAIDAQLTLMKERGRRPISDFESYRYLSWPELNSLFKSRLLGDASRAYPAQTGTDPRTPGFIQECEQLVGDSRTLFAGASRAQLLVNGPASFEQRYRLIRNARSSIWITTWAFGNMDDYTAKFTARLLLDKAKSENVDVRIVVDGQIATTQYPEVIDFLLMENERIQDANKKIKITRWRHADFPYFGNHRKVMIVDRAKMIIGGMNFGDEYSHAYDPERKGPGRVLKAKDYWRDTDLLLEGRIVDQAIQHFVFNWNRAQNQIAKSKQKKLIPENEALSVPFDDTLDKNPNLNVPSGQAQVMLVDRDPTQLELDTIYLLTLKMIISARRSIDISNAYYIATQPIEEALISAAKSGVKIRIHTNSQDSVDVGELVKPIYRGLSMLLNASENVEVYLQKTNTLHSKYLLVDDAVGWVGSYNLHPRSLRLETETIAVVSGAGIAHQLKSQFESDVAAAQKITRSERQILELKNSLLQDLAEHFFFDLL